MNCPFESTRGMVLMYDHGPYMSLSEHCRRYESNQQNNCRPIHASNAQSLQTNLVIQILHHHFASIDVQSLARDQRLAMSSIHSVLERFHAVPTHFMANELIVEFDSIFEIGFVLM